MWQLNVNQARDESSQKGENYMLINRKIIFLIVISSLRLDGSILASQFVILLNLRWNSMMFKDAICAQLNANKSYQES